MCPVSNEPSDPDLYSGNFEIGTYEITYGLAVLAILVDCDVDHFHCLCFNFFRISESNYL
jgi:hypothetical protein